MMDKLDQYLLDLFDKVVEKYCKLTGKDNFSLACFTLYFSYFIVVLSQFGEYFFGEGSALLFWLIIILWFIDTLAIRHRFKKLKSMSDRLSYGQLLTFDDVDTIKRVAWDRKWYVIAFFIFLIPAFNDRFFLMFTFSLAVRAISCYFASCFDGGGTSAYERAKERVKEAVKKLKNVKIPSPTPAPVGAG